MPYRDVFTYKRHYRYRGVISFTEEQAAALMDKYEWEQVPEAPSFDFRQY